MGRIQRVALKVSLQLFLAGIFIASLQVDEGIPSKEESTIHLPLYVLFGSFLIAPAVLLTLVVCIVALLGWIDRHLVGAGLP